MKKQNGITLIALVISIIVMLILAGVSINAVVGDNGVIGKAQETLYLQSCAVLEEFLQMEASNYALEENPYKTQYGLLRAKHPGWFYQNAQGYILDSDGHVMYLIKKSGLPEEIQDQITGGDANKVSQYYKQVDVYGVTSDLQVYYCNNGTDTILGLTIEDLEKDDPLEIAYDEDSLLSKVINGTNEEGKANEALSEQDLKSIKTLTIDTTEKLALLNEFIKLPTLQTVYFENITIPTLNGIQNAPTITEVRFTNCSVSDYSGMCGLTKLNKLYLIQPAGKNEDVANLCSTDKGIATAEFSNLQYFGIVGSEKYIQSTKKEYDTTRYDVTDVSGLSNLSKTTKEAIQCMYLQNLQLTSIASLAEYKNITVLRVEYNALATFEGIQNMSKLTYIFAPNLYSNVTSAYTLGINETDTQNTNTDALSYIYKDEDGKNTKLYFLDVQNAQKLKWSSYLSTCTGLRYLYMDNNTSIKDVSTIANVIGNCGTKYTISSNYTIEIISDNSVKLDLKNQTLTVTQFERLKNNLNLTQLWLENITLVDDNNIEIVSKEFNNKVNEVLSTCTNLKVLSLAKLTDMSTIEFIKNASNIEFLDLYNTSIPTNFGDISKNGLELLNENAKNLRGLRINGIVTNGICNIDLQYINDTVVRLVDIYYKEDHHQHMIFREFSSYHFRGLDVWRKECLQTINGCYGFNTIVMQTRYDFEWDLSNENNLTAVYIRWDSYGNITLPDSVKVVAMENAQDLYFDISKLNDFEVRLMSSTLDCILNTLETYNPNSKIKLLEFRPNALLKGKTDFTFLEEYNFTIEAIYADYYSNKNTTVVSLDGMESIKGLKNVFINGYENLSDIDALAKCTQLETVNINGTKIKDISCFNVIYENETLTSGTPNLNSLSITNSSIVDISSLSSLKDTLNYINLNNNNLNDIKPLENLKKLETLYLEKNALYDSSYDKNGKAYYTLTVFSDLNQKQDGSLRNLYLSGNNIEDFSMLQDSNLQWDAKSGW